MHRRKPRISLIWAMSRNRIIGRDNALPWRLPADLQHFKQVTLGKPIIMGRKTWESLPGRLPQRRHIVVTRQRDYQAAGAETAPDLQSAIELAGDVDEVMIVGGASLYALALPLADQLYLTLVDAEVEGDTRFPDFDLSEWREVSRRRHAPDKANSHGMEFLQLIRKR